MPPQLSLLIGALHSLFALALYSRPFASSSQVSNDLILLFSYPQPLYETPRMLFFSCFPKPKVKTFLLPRSPYSPQNANFQFQIPLSLEIISWIWLIHNKLRMSRYSTFPGMFPFCKDLVNSNNSVVDGILSHVRKLNEEFWAMWRRAEERRGLP